MPQLRDSSMMQVTTGSSAGTCHPAAALADWVADDAVGECDAVASYSAAGECTMPGGSL
jgi:hypothetical protein